MHVSGLKEALEAKYEELGEAEATIRKMASEVSCFCNNNFTNCGGYQT